MGLVLLGCLGIIAVILLFSAIGGLIFMLLWNFIAPAFGLPQLDFWQSWAIWILIGMVGAAFRSVVSKS